RVPSKSGAHGICPGVTIGLCLLTSFAGLGCAAGALPTSVAPPHASQAVRETTSRPAEGAAFTAEGALAEDRATALLLSMTARCSADMALVDNRVCVDRWEGSLVEHVSGRADRAWSPYRPVDGHELAIRAVSRPGVIPQGYISGKQAQMACMASGKRLCSAD